MEEKKCGQRNQDRAQQQVKIDFFKRPLDKPRLVAHDLHLKISRNNRLQLFDPPLHRIDYFHGVATGLFSNDDTLSEQLTAAGIATNERLWRMPLGKDYDKMIDSKFADMKNTGGRHAGSITAAHFIGRFVGETPWAHLDIAGTAMGSPLDEINQSWGSGYGVRLLDQLVRANYES